MLSDSVVWYVSVYTNSLKPWIILVVAAVLVALFRFYSFLLEAMKPSFVLFFFSSGLHQARTFFPCADLLKMLLTVIFVHFLLRLALR